MKKLYILAIFITSIISGTFSFFNIEFSNIGDSFINNIVGVHFKGGGNDFGGIIFITGKKNIPWENISANGNTIQNCQEKLKGYYFNNMHGNILFPIDKESLQTWNNIDNSYYSGLNLSGGFYTSCSGDLNSTYGKIDYSIDNKYLFSLYAGFEGDPINNNINLNFKDNLQFITKGGKNYFIGLIYDSDYGLGFVGGKVVSGFNLVVNELNNQSVNDYVISIDDDGNSDDKIITQSGHPNVWIIPTPGIGSIINLLVKGLINITQNVDNNIIIQKYKHDVIPDKTIVTNYQQTNIAFNQARKNVYKYCEGSWFIPTNGNINNNYKGKKVCIKGNNLILKINADLGVNGKTTNIVIVGKNNKLIIQKNQTSPGHINIYLENGFVLFDNNINLLNIDGDGNENNINPITSGAIFNGNIIVKGLVAGYNNISSFQLENIEPFPHKLYIQGSLVSLNSIGGNDKRIEYITNILPNINNLDINNKERILGYINIMNAFNWYCLGTEGSDGVKCGDVNDKYSLKSIIIKKKHYKNPFIK